MKDRFHIALALLLSLPAVACDAPAGAGEAGASNAFCREALAGVDAFMAEATAAEAEAAVDDEVAERRGGTVVVGSIGEFPSGMNSLVSSDYTENQHHLFVNLMTLVRLDEDLEPMPYLAERWEFSEDGSELTFQLRDDVFWHDGVRTTADDVAFTFLRATDPETAFPNSAFWSRYVPGAEGVEVVDSFTVRFRLEPHAGMLDPWRAVGILPRHLLEDVPPAELRQHPFGSRCPVGNGPFRFVEHRTDERWVFDANPAFPEALGGRPNIDRYVHRIVPEITTLLTELLTENIDVYIAPSPEQAEAIVDADDLRLIAYPFRSYMFVAWNTRKPQFEDARVRRAIAVATNRQEVVDALLYGYGTIANTGVPPVHWAYDRSLEDSLRYDPDEARALLDDAGWIDRDGDGIRENAEGVRLEFSLKYNGGNRQRQDIAEIMQSQLRQVGIALQPQVVEWSTLSGQLLSPSRDFDGILLSWVTEFNVDDSDLFHSSGIDEPLGFAGIQDERLDALLDTLPTVIDPEDAAPLWREYQQRVIEIQPVTYFLFQDRLIGVNRRIQDVTMDVRGEWVGIADWWIPSELRRAGGRAVTP